MDWTTRKVKAVATGTANKITRKGHEDVTDAERLALLERTYLEVIEAVDGVALRLQYQRPRLLEACDKLKQRGNRTSVTLVRELVTEAESLMDDLETARQENHRLQQELRVGNQKNYKLEGEIEANKRDHRATLAQISMHHKYEVDRMTREHSAETDKLSRDYRLKEDQLVETYHVEKARFVKDAEAYSTALLEHDNFKPMSDAELKIEFLELAQAVEDLASLKWKDRYQDDADWTSSHPLPASRLRRYVLQESIWTTLHEYIFCSPFRIFGAEGKNLERQWNERFGTDSQRDNGFYTWPPPEMEAERWRYVTVTEGHAAAIRHPQPSDYDTRKPLELGHNKSRDELRAKLKSALGEVVNLEDGELKMIDELVVKAIRLWLNFAMQRCRILIVMSKGQESTNRLLVTPKLQRLGNSKGHNLSEPPVTIGGCAGKIEEVTM